MILHITARSAINFFLQQNFCINFFILLFLYFIIYFLIFSLIHCSGVLLLPLLGPPHSSSLHGSSSCLEPLLSGPVCCLRGTLVLLLDTTALASDATAAFGATLNPGTGWTRTAGPVNFSLVFYLLLH
jgi:hypothetical protein